MISILGFLVILAPLVIVHEFGHFFFARLFNVKAEAFSIGFGPRLLKWQWGETEFRVSLIPLGGYVKLLGEEPGVELSAADKSRSLQAALPWKRFFIFLGGPLFNFIFAALVFMVILVLGEPQIANYVGRIEKGTQAQSVGLVAGDRVLSIDGEPMTYFRDIAIKIHENPGQGQAWVLERTSEKNQRLELKITPSVRKGYSQYGEEKDVGEIPGLFPYARGIQIGVSNPQSQAAKLGIQTGDEWVSYNGSEIKNWEQLEKRYAETPKGTVVPFEIRRDGKVLAKSFQVAAKKRDLASDFGAFNSELFVKTVVKASPAEKAGLMAGDRVVAFQGKEATSFETVKEQIQNSGEGVTSGTPKVVMKVERLGKMLSLNIEPEGKSVRDPSLRKKMAYTIGMMPMLTIMEPPMILERIWNPLKLVSEAVYRMVDYSWRNFVSIGKMFTGDVSLATLGGPILIGKIAGDSIERGLIAFLTTMAILSIGLGVLNILPVPVLDGGHILLLGVEVVRGRPLTMRQTEVIQQVGLSLILLLMVVVMRNDLTRLPFFN